ncbi:aspartate/glutamate racemase family protein [Nocardioides sp. YIM 152588]|uniref:aspartate/glutamate racemase family protein n=1 Tax=Nocardioides sp. YIM 152588 TaxID=3158259 RepID=UPI0032E4D863
MVTLGFLHTAEVHVATFEALVGEAAPASAAATVHAVAPDLLDRARAEGPTPDLAEGVRAAVADVVARGADVVVCTCSTLGPIAESVDAGVAVLRVDRPMAAAAVAAGPRIGVVAALESTLAPTLGLIAGEAQRAGVAPAVVDAWVPEAWAAFESGDLAGYHAQVAAAARSIAGEVDVVVLAQASMAGAQPLLADLGVPVLVSPGLAVRAALAAAGRPRGR